MATSVREHDGARHVTISEVAHAPGTVFLTVHETPHPRASNQEPRELGCYAFDKATLIEALRDEFGLVDPLEMAFAAS